jgi:AcrR family transcriptional regulator
MHELAERGYPAVSFETVAKRAGVHKTTLYRRWTRPEGLLLEAALEFSGNSVPLPDTGSLRDDLLLLARHMAESLNSPGPQAMLRAVVTEAKHNPELADVARKYWRARFNHIGGIVRRGVERGEVSISIDSHLVIESLTGPIYMRALVTQEPVDDRFIEDLVDLVRTAATGESFALADVREAM